MQATADETFVLYAVLHTHKEGTDATSVPQQLFYCAIPAPRCGNVPKLFFGVSGSSDREGFIACQLT